MDEIYYYLNPKSWELGFFEPIPNGNLLNYTSWKFIDQITFSVASSGSYSFKTVEIIYHNTGAPGETVTYSYPNVSTILNTMGLYVGGSNPSKYKDIYGKKFTLRAEWEPITSGLYGYGSVDNTLTVAPSGVLLLKSSNLAINNGKTNYH